MVMTIWVIRLRQINTVLMTFLRQKMRQAHGHFLLHRSKPLYIAGYIQDKFRYKDVIFSLGVRVDRYDANTKVLKDPYSLYDIMSAKDYYAMLGKKQSRQNIYKTRECG